MEGAEATCSCAKLGYLYLLLIIVFNFKVDNTGTTSGKMRWTAEMELVLINVWQENIEQLRGAQIK